MEEVVEEAAAATLGEEATVPPEVALEVVVRSLEIQDAEPIRSAPMTEAPASSRGGGPGNGGQAPGGSPSGRAVDEGR
jgi:hypothetical protein